MKRFFLPVVILVPVWLMGCGGLAPSARSEMVKEVSGIVQEQSLTAMRALLDSFLPMILDKLAALGFTPETLAALKSGIAAAADSALAKAAEIARENAEKAVERLIPPADPSKSADGSGGLWGALALFVAQLGAGLLKAKVTA